MTHHTFRTLIPPGTTLSTAVDLGQYRLVGIVLETLDLCDLTFDVSADGALFAVLHEAMSDDMYAPVVTRQVHTGQALRLDSDVFRPWRFLRVCSSTLQPDGASLLLVCEKEDD